MSTQNVNQSSFVIPSSVFEKIRRKNSFLLAYLSVLSFCWIFTNMIFFADCLVHWCLFAGGFFFGYYCKYVLVYNNLLPHWYALLGAITSLILSLAWTKQKYERRQYYFSHYYIIFYGLVCFLISSCFMISDNLDIAFYFGFIGLSTIYVSSYSFISLRSTSRGFRPMFISLGNTLFFAGLCTGFVIFSEFEPTKSGWVYLSVTIAMLVGTVITEILQYTDLQYYKKSRDLVFDLMNDERLVFLPMRSVQNIFTDRPEYFFTKNRQWFVVALAGLTILEQPFVLSPTYLQMAWSSTLDYLNVQYLYGPFLLFTIGCAIGTGLLARYQSKYIYLMFGLIKVTVMAAILGIYNIDRAANSFYFLCFYYISMGVYSGVALQLVVECTPFLYTELALALALTLKLASFEILKYEMLVDDSWEWLLGISVLSMMITVICLILVPLMAPPAEGLIEIRNHLLGIRRHSPIVCHTKIWNSNSFLQHDIEPNEFTNVCIEGSRVFQQYPRVDGSSQRV